MIINNLLNNNNNINYRLLLLLKFNFLSRTRQKKKKEKMEKKVFWIEYKNQPKGHIIYETQAILDQNTTILQVQLCAKLIKFGKMCLQYNFDLKFEIKEKYVIFQIQQQQMKFYLPNNDSKLWRQVLRLHLNQKGFNQIFKPIKKIGKGNFASVYLVQKNQNKIRYAVKAFSKQSAYSEENGKQCLIKQIEIMRCLHHPNLMKLQQVFQSDNSLYIIFELLEGGQLLQRLKQKKKLTHNQVKQVMKCLLSGVKQMHDKGIMHRDLKPENILIREKGGLQCVIADFGLAQFVNSDQFLFARCGTPGYVAPQVINIKDTRKMYNSICDIFSLGLTFHILIFGISIFNKKTYNEVVAQNRACKYNFEQQHYKKIPPQTLDLLKKMLRVNPQQRITAQQALDHPYFNLIQSSDQTKTILQDINKNQICLPQFKQLQKQGIDNDSCLSFTLGKQNIINGNTNTLVDTQKTQTSTFGKTMVPGRISKISKFSRIQ